MTDQEIDDLLLPWQTEMMMEIASAYPEIDLAAVRIRMGSRMNYLITVEAEVRVRLAMNAFAIFPLATGPDGNDVIIDLENLRTKEYAILPIRYWIQTLVRRCESRDVHVGNRVFRGVK